jgi:RNA polymerase sigma-70 factor (ECF subfamily)
MGGMTGGLDGELLAHGKALRTLARALVGEQHADDLVQDTVVQALRRRGEAPDAPRAWMATVMRFVAHKLRRGERRRVARERLVAAASADGMMAPADAGVAAREAFQQVTAAVTALPEPYHTTILLRYLRELAPADVAAAMGVPLATVKTRLVRGLALLRERFDGEQRARGGGDWRAGLAAAFGIERLVPAGAAAAGGILMTATAKWIGGTVTAAALAAMWWLGDVAPAAPPGAGRATGGGATPIAASAQPTAEAGADAAKAATRRSAADAPAAGAPLATIHGRLVDEDGRPLPGIDVELRGRRIEGGMGKDFDREYGEWLLARGARRWSDQRVTSGADGAFAFAAEPSPLSLAVRVRAPVEHAIGVDQLDEPREVDLGDLVVRPACSLRCRVVDERGRAVVSAAVRIERSRDEQLRMSRTRVFAARLGAPTHAAGDGIVTATVVAGTFEVKVNGRRVVAGGSLVVPPRAPSFVHEVVVANAGTDETITGIVVDERGGPLADAGVYATRESHSFASTDALGRFELPRGDQPDGEVSVTAYDDGHEWAPSVLRARWGERDLRIVLRDLVAIDVAAVDVERGEPVTDFTVTVFKLPDDGNGGQSSSERASGEHANGVARIDGLVRGRHRVVVVPHRFDLWRSEPALVEAVPGRVARVEVRLPRAADRALVVQHADGRTVAGATVELAAAGAVPADAEGAGVKLVPLSGWDPATPFERALLGEWATGAAGRALLHGPAGVPVIARVRHDRFASFLVGPFVLDGGEPVVATVPAGGALVGRVGPAAILPELAPGAEQGSAGRRPGFRLRRGKGQDAEMVPPAGADAAYVQPDGTFRIDGVPPGEWWLALEPWDRTEGKQRISVGWAAVAVARVAVRAGETTDTRVDLASWQPATLTGTVRCNGELVRDGRVEIAIAHASPEYPNARWLQPAATAGDGTFRYRGRGGIVTVGVRRGDPNGATHVVFARQSAVLPPGGSLSLDVDVVACPVRLRAVDAGGAPVAHAELVLVSDDGSLVHGLRATDADGRTAGETEPGAFAVRLGSPQGLVLQRITMVAGNTDELTVTVPQRR